MKRGKRKEKGKIKDEMLKHFFEQEISMGSEWQKRLLQMCREGALPPHIYFSIFTWKSSMSADEGPDHDKFHSQQTDWYHNGINVPKNCTNGIF